MREKKLSHFISITCIALLVFYSNLTIAFAQDITAKDVEKSKLEKEYAENQKAIAEAQKAELDAKFPKPDASALVGGTNVKGDFIEAKMLGYCAMKTAAKKVSDRIIAKGFTTPKFIIYNESDVKMLIRYQLMLQRLEILEQGYINLCATHGCAGGAGVRAFGAGLIANKVLDYLSLLKTDIDITGTEFNIGEKEIVAEVFNNLPNYELYYPQRIPLSATNFLGAGGVINSALFNKIVTLGQQYDRARTVNAAGVSERDRLDSLYNATMTELGLGEIPTPPGGGGAPPPAACPANCSQTTNVNVNVGDKAKEEGSGSGSSDKTFFSYLQAEKLYVKITQGNTYWLDLQVVKAGGNIRVKSNIITNFMIGSRVNFSGGAIVYFNVFDYQGISKLSGVVPTYEKYRKSSRINETCNKDKNQEKGKENK